jgi:hypothetical protein
MQQGTGLNNLDQIQLDRSTHKIKGKKEKRKVKKKKVSLKKDKSAPIHPSTHPPIHPSTRISHKLNSKRLKPSI